MKKKKEKKNGESQLDFFTYSLQYSLQPWSTQSRKQYAHILSNGIDFD